VEEEEEVLKPLELMFFKGWGEMTDEEKLLSLKWEVERLGRKVDFALSWILGVPRREIARKIVELEEELEKRVEKRSNL